MNKYLILSGGMLLFVLLTQCKKDEITTPENNVSLLISRINLLRQSGCNCGTEYMAPVPSLSSNNQLQNAATMHAKDMAEQNYFDHLSPNGVTPAERAIEAGYKGDFRAENLARGYLEVDQVINAWKISVSHCKAMMDAKSKEIGAGMTQNYWVVTFGSSL
ncbi:Cysteine-rich secretory protein family protein [Pedobacter terrae]|uniref:Cysteine-rich secretory protein family protein n=1 Tax=Pedobacter terrae TaxID=405671 RepID=A0A1G7SNP2_9SPHI|nr:CAP domain-containing protein [Pedobacter terrae]SDG23870.1 Cysteine-rich secretory protein family protein [Pedobacter terrae]